MEADTFIQVRDALREVRDKRLYRAQYDTFEDYCRLRWNLDPEFVNRLLTEQTLWLI